VEQSILLSTKTVMKVNPQETHFDEELLMYINNALSQLGQLGVGDGSLQISDSTAVWADVDAADAQLGMVKQYVFLKVKEQFDAPATGFHLEAANRQLQELTWRITNGPEVPA
jgi:hypothetical protein